MNTANFKSLHAGKEKPECIEDTELNILKKKVNKITQRGVCPR